MRYFLYNLALVVFFPFAAVYLIASNIRRLSGGAVSGRRTEDGDRSERSEERFCKELSQRHGRVPVEH